MPSYSVAEAKNNLPRLIDRALAGEEVTITRHGKPVVEIHRTRPEAGDQGAATRALLALRETWAEIAMPATPMRDWLYDDYAF